MFQNTLFYLPEGLNSNSITDFDKQTRHSKYIQDCDKLEAMKVLVNINFIKTLAKNRMKL